MRWNVRILPALLVALTADGASSARAQAQNPPGPAPAAPAAKAAPVDPKRLVELLNLWEQNSSRLTTLDVEMTRTDKSEAWGELEHYKARAILKTPNLAWLDFKKEVEVVDPKTKEKTKSFVPHERIICTGNEVWQYRSDTKQIFIYPLEKDVQQRALEEGPLPFLFNFKAGAAQKRYEMALIDENPDTYTILIKPRLTIDQESFTKAWVVLDRKHFLLPSRILLLAPDGKSSKDFALTLTEKSTTKPIMAANFKGELYAGWKVVRNPGGDAKPTPAPATRAAQPAPAVAGAPSSSRAGAASPPQSPASKPRGIFGGRRN